MPNARDVLQHGRDRLSAALSRGDAREHERDLWVIVQRQPVRQGIAPPAPTATKILPRPRIKERSLEAAMFGDGGAVEAISLQRYTITAISRSYSEDLFTSASYFLIIEGEPALDAEGLLARLSAHRYQRYKLDGNPNRMTREWTMNLVEDSN